MSEALSVSLLHVGYGNFLSSSDYFKINVFEKFFQLYNQSVKQFGSRSA